ncbi:hypothetical protein LTR37_005396 [Vermiconidia calcicola]|uniref:Uncharacterized protein n=1 Tax=Vermiconidia calcicola TaxID=1690605 RepID=A0ACC3NJH3_9PEZI|nr:hypothetical protein LTR37_005396 [Vermiconidia calcicola]
MPSESQLEKRAAPHQPSIGVLPRKWPGDIQYLTSPTYSPMITVDERIALSRLTAESTTYAKIPPEALKSPCPRVDIRTIENTEHPAHGQRGLFASQHLQPDLFVCLYLGHVHTNSMSDTDPHSDYDLSYDRDIGLSVDAARSGSEARFANDYRGVAERPNSEFRDCFVQVKSDKRSGGLKWERRVGIFVLSAGKAGKRKAGVKAGEEILVTYGKGYWEGRKLMATFRKDFEMLRIADTALQA